MSDLPPRNPRFRGGKSTPRSFRLNDELWSVILTRSKAEGHTPTEIVTHLLETYAAQIRRRHKLQEKIIVHVEGED